MPVRSCWIAQGSTTSAWASTDCEGCPVTATTKWPADSAALATAWSGKSLSGSEPSRTRARTWVPAPVARPGALAGHGGQDAGRIEPGGGRHRAPGRGEALAPGVEGHPPGQQARGQAHVERRRTRCPGAARAGTSPWAAPRPARGGRRRPPRPTRRRTGARPRRRRPRHRDARPAGCGRPPSAPSARALPSWWVPNAVAAASSPVRALATSGASPGRMARVASANGVSAVGVGAISMSFGLPFNASRSRRKRTGSSSRRSPVSVMSSGADAAWSMVARGSPSTRSAGRPSPSWASTESVPITPLASLAQA